MRETIIIAPFANESELLRTLARYGVNTFGTRIMNTVELAEYALMAAGETVTETFIKENKSAALIYSFLKEIAYFSSASFTDAKNISSTLNSVRRLIPGNESDTIHEKLSNGEFSENNTALCKVYDRYISELKSNSLIDDIQLIRRAINRSSALKADFIALSEYPLTPLEKRFIETLSDGNYKVMSFCELLNAPEKAPDFSDITKAYGASNEAENIISTIFENDIPLDGCTIAVTDTARYSQLFYDISRQHAIPITFGCGLPIGNSLPAVLLRNFYNWATSGYHGVDSLHALIFSESFDRKKLIEQLAIDNAKTLAKLIKIAGQFRLSCDKTENSNRISAYFKAYPEESENVELITLMFAEFELGCSYIVKNYSRIRTGFAGKLDRSAVNVICDELDAYTVFAGSSEIDIIPGILRSSVCSELSRPGHLHVTGIYQAMFSIRENLFVAGLSAGSFPGSPAENYLMADGDYLLFDKDAPTSERRISQNKEYLIALMKIASALGLNTHLSYSEFDTAELKEENASSVLFEIFKRKNGCDSTLEDFENSIHCTGFFENSVSVSRLIGRAYNRGANIICKAAESSEQTAELSFDRAFSPTAVEDYFKCPRMFFFSHILHMKSDESDDVFTIISPKDMGLLIHNLMDNSAKNKITHEEFASQAEQLFRGYLASRPPINEPELKRVHDIFMAMALNGYSYAPENNVLYSEYNIEPVKIGNITLKGRLDRVEKTPDDRFIIVDYKTGGRIKHEANDIESCLQILLYAAMLKENGINISECEYRYLRSNQSVKCEYNSIVENRLKELLSSFVDSVRNVDFPANGDCTYCDFKNICQKGEKSDE